MTDILPPVHGTIVVDVTEEELGAAGGRQNVLWHVNRVAPTRFELRAWFVDHITREYYESQRPLIAISSACASNLVPRGFVLLPDGGPGDWYVAPPSRRRKEAA